MAVLVMSLFVRLLFSLPLTLSYLYYFLFRLEVDKRVPDAISYTQAKQNLTETMDAVCRGVFSHKESRV